MNIVDRFVADRAETVSRLLVGALFLALAWRLGVDFAKTQRVTDLLLLVGEGLVVILTCIRRPAHIVDRRSSARLVTTLSMLAPLLVRPSSASPFMSEAAATTVAALGLAVVVGGKMSLGTSFGLLPANRGVMVGGLYRFVRHPIYMGYLLTHIPFLAAHPSSWNLMVIVVGDAALIVRALYEEKTLGTDPQYVRYCQIVKWRLVPGIC